jgi:hypothetical protein
LRPRCSATASAPGRRWPLPGGRASRSNQPRSAPRPRSSTNGQVDMALAAARRRPPAARRRACRASAEGRRPLPVNGCVKRPRSAKRRPQSAGGVASMRRSWRRTPLRSTRSTSDSVRARRRACRRSSAACHAPDHELVLLEKPVQQRRIGRFGAGLHVQTANADATLRHRAARPGARRPGASWAKRGSSAHSVAGDSAADRARVRQRHAALAIEHAHVVELEGRDPAAADDADGPIDSGAPIAAPTRCSICGRQSSRRGRMPQCSVSHAISARLHTASNTPASRPLGSRGAQRSGQARRPGSGGGAAGQGDGNEDMQRAGGSRCHESRQADVPAAFGHPGSGPI